MKAVISLNVARVGRRRKQHRTRAEFDMFLVGLQS
jgi:hypothetical protein